MYHLAHFMDDISPKPLILFCSFCQLTPWHCLCSHRTGTVLRGEDRNKACQGGSVVFIYVQAAFSPFIFRDC